MDLSCALAAVPFRFADNNAFWDTEKNLMSYGDGDGSKYSYFSLGLDVVAHEVRALYDVLFLVSPPGPGPARLSRLTLE